jgi:small-conductance mechanosensitive channel
MRPLKPHAKQHPQPPDQFRECASFLIGCDAALAAAAAMALMLVFSFNLHLAFTIAAGVALLFCLYLIHRWSQVQKRGVSHTLIWRIIDPRELPQEANAIRGAQAHVEGLLLRFAEGASGLCIALCALAMLVASQ